MEILDNQPSSENVLTDKMRQWLTESAKWARFLSIVGFCFIGLMCIMVFSFGSLLSFLGSQTEGMGNLAFAGAQGAFMIMFILLILFYFFPVLYLYQFATHTLKSVDHYDAGQLEKGLEKLKSFFKFIGITTLIMLGFYALMLILSILF